MSAVFDDLLRLLHWEYAPYRGHVDDRVYQDVGCDKPKRARWMVRGGKYVCLGCGKRCSLVDPAGFELMLPVTIRTKSFAYANLPAVSAEELLRKKMLLTVREVEFILSLSSRTIYTLVEEGRLDCHPDPPKRITADSVRREVARLKEG